MSTEALLDLLERLEPEFPLRPAYDDNHLSWLFETMEMVDLGRLVRRVVRADDGEPLGAYVMLLRVHGHASVVEVVAGADRAGLVLDHLIYDAAAAGAVELGGRVEPHLLPHLAERKCRLTRAEWVTFHAADPALVQAVRSGRSLVTRMDGEWWMRPFPLGPPARLDDGASSRR